MSGGSPAQHPRATATLGVALGVAFAVCFATGLVSDRLQVTGRGEPPRPAYGRGFWLALAARVPAHPPAHCFGCSIHHSVNSVQRPSASRRMTHRLLKVWGGSR
jgi:hypothetical protein